MRQDSAAQETLELFGDVLRQTFTLQLRQRFEGPVVGNDRFIKGCLFRSARLINPRSRVPNGRTSMSGLFSHIDWRQYGEILFERKGREFTLQRLS